MTAESTVTSSSAPDDALELADIQAGALIPGRPRTPARTRLCALMTRTPGASCSAASCPMSTRQPHSIRKNRWRSG